MIKLKVENKLYKVNIEYYDQSLTVVTISTASGYVLGTGISATHHLDQFNKAIGRKVAFGRALQDAAFTKDERTQLWERYFESVRGV